MNRGLAFLAGALLPVAVMFAGETTLSTGAMQELAAAGLRLRPFRGLSERPFPVIPAFTYENAQTRERLEAYDPRELWLQAQREGLFAGDEGTLTLYTLRHHPLEAIPLINGKHLPRAAFEDAMARQEVAWNKSTIRTWIEHTTGWEIDRSMETLDRRRYPYPLVAFTFKRHTDYAMAAVLRLPLRRGGDRVVAVIFEAPPGLRVRNLERAMGALVSSLEPIDREADDRGPSMSFQSRKARGDTDNRSPEYEAARQRVIANLRNLDNWWYVETSNYVIASNLPRKDRRLVEMIQTDIEILRRAYHRFLVPAVPIREVSMVRVFADRREYEDYVGEQMKWSGGAWMPARKELVISPLELDNRKLQREVLLGVVYHEAFHQYVHYALDGHELPVWFDEGHAALFEAAEVDRHKGTVEVGENQIWTPIAERVVGSPADDLRRLLHLTHQDFYGEGRELNYAMAWAFVYFLRKGAPAMEITRYDGLADQVVESVAKGRPAAADVAGIILATYKLDDLQRDFRTFWASQKYRKKAARLELFEEE